MKIRLTAYGSTIALHCLVPCFAKSSNCSEETFFVELEKPHDTLELHAVKRIEPLLLAHSILEKCDW